MRFGKFLYGGLTIAIAASILTFTLILKLHPGVKIWELAWPALFRFLVFQGPDGDPISTMLMPSYANWTGTEWLLHAHGFQYWRPHKTPWSAVVFARIISLAPSCNFYDDRENARYKENMKDVVANPVFTKLHKTPPPLLYITIPASATSATGRTIPMVYTALLGNTDNTGRFNAHVTLPAQLPPGPIPAIIPGTTLILPESRQYLISPTGTGPIIISDIDDTLRVTRIWDPPQALMNAIGHPFTPWTAPGSASMPNVYKHWRARWSDAHFHYLSICVPQNIVFSWAGLRRWYPAGTFETRWTGESGSGVRYTRLRRMAETFPHRKLVLVGDSSNAQVLRDYPKLYQEFPHTVACILIRNVSATEPGIRSAFSADPEVYGGFRGMPRERYFFFERPGDVRDVDFARGECGDGARAGRELRDLGKLWHLRNWAAKTSRAFWKGVWMPWGVLLRRDGTAGEGGKGESV
ncbi:hypothetical protein W97_06213 [Coniosporium apollinis CBS 100218]|uniref:Phosphatidate phosphatase APP1 catalytic domain-containing protein n=1 Tax=Coniosporium apollinis (strain CBS 100218) TaxID=1168221 RepID=R7YYR9_CONA1|nr:uncharacterized protein W97_06213 [Coniosporium apollinis CBS 100218]EON66811.1 hypothetical protein W97_06213 [Coniosporium apollinis CBS 100218]